MSAEEISLVPSQNGLVNVFQDDALRFGCGPSHPHQNQHQHQQPRVGADPAKTRELASYNIDEKLFSSSSSSPSPFPGHQAPHDFPLNIYHRASDQPRHPHGTSVDESEPDPDEDDEDDEEDDDEEEDDDVDDDDNGGRRRYHRQLVTAAAVDSNNNNNNNNSININKNNNNNKSSNINTTNANNNASGNFDKLGNGNGKHKQQSSFGGSGLELMLVKDGAGVGVEQAVTMAEPDGEMFYSQYLQAAEGSGGGGKDMGVDNGCGFSGRKGVSSFSSESGESLRAILSDPVTGALMDDAMILPCGHSFGSAGIQHVIRMKACYTCSHSTSEDSIAPNLSLRAAVQAFRREEDLQFYRSSKRRRERFDQDKGSYGGSTVMDPPRGRGVQFPFSVADRVIIKGNKRTPQRFVGREAVVTTQCLNGWYVVKTLDNAESVKLQYRSLAKVSDDVSSKTMSSKMVPNWL